MSICMARLPLMRSCLFCPVKRCVFKSRLKPFRLDLPFVAGGEAAIAFRVTCVYLPSIRAPSLCDQYQLILLGDRGR